MKAIETNERASRQREMTVVLVNLGRSSYLAPSSSRFERIGQQVHDAAWRTGGTTSSATVRRHAPGHYPRTTLPAVSAVPTGTVPISLWPLAGHGFCSVPPPYRQTRENKPVSSRRLHCPAGPWPFPPCPCPWPRGGWAWPPWGWQLPPPRGRPSSPAPWPPALSAACASTARLPIIAVSRRGMSSSWNSQIQLTK